MSGNKKSIYSKIIVLVIVVFVTAVITWNIAIMSFSGDKYLLTNAQFERFEEYKKIEEIIAVIDKEYYSDYEQQNVLESMYEGIVQGLGDKYSEYLTDEELEILKNYENGVFFGVGFTLYIDQSTGEVSVSSVYENSPADEQGVKINDQILQINGENITGYSSDKINALVAGEVGTTIKFTIKNDEGTREVELAREEIQRTEVSTALLSNGTVGYVRLNSFSGESADQVIDAFEEYEKDGIQDYILDLRHNGGGLIDSAIDITDFLMPSGTICYTQGKGEIEKVYESDNDSFGKNLVILVNENTASASEIVAGALQKSGVATIVGQNTFGKGIIQEIYTLTDGESAVKLTTNYYYFADGSTPNEVGIAPDVEIEMDYKLINTEEDVQLEAALKELGK